MNMNEQIRQQESMNTARYGVSDAGGQDVLTEMQEDLTGLTLTPDRVKIPAGGGTVFEIQGEDGESEMVREIIGVILHQHPAYALYHDRYSGGNNPPECGSFDGVQGIGVPGGDCATCPYNQFGSGEGTAKLCKNKRQLYVLQENELFPVVLSLPTGSLRGFTRYLKSQLSRGRRLNQIVTRISLKKATSSSGIVYSQAVFGFERELTVKEREAIAPMIVRAKEYASGLTVGSMRDEEMNNSGMGL